ncbi:MAG: hypothetical protein HY848_02360 [Betaproteobacteria bacterium]|nr:hypothetical protein [Betaproteobacteria bacterium]
MTLQTLILPFLLAIAMNFVWRYFQPIKGQTIWFLGISSIAGSAAGVFAGLLLGGSAMTDNFYWIYVALPLVAAAITTRVQELAIGWTAQDEKGEE